MKRILTAATAALFLAACETAYPPQDPYGEPYPPQDPYGQGYPPQEPYGDPGYSPYPPQDPYGASDPAQPYPPQAYPPGPSGSCPIASSRNWQARLETTAGHDQLPTLVVTGTIVAPTGGYSMEFEPYLQSRRSRPVQLVATLRPNPPQGPATQAQTIHDVRWQWPIQTGPVGSVTIACGDRTLAEISPVPTTP